MKDSFLIYKPFYKPISRLSDKQLGRLFRAIFKYQLGEEVTVEEDIEMAFEFFKNQFEIDELKYQGIVERNRNNGRKGGNDKNSETVKSKSSGSQTSHSTPNNPVGAKRASGGLNDNENDNDLKENTIDGVKEKRFAPPTLENVSEYCREMGYTNVDAARFIDFYTSNGWMVGKNRMKDWKAAVRNWDRREKNPQRQDGVAEVAKKNRFHNLEEHGYDYDAMVWGMVGAAAQGEAGSAVEPGTG